VLLVIGGNLDIRAKVICVEARFMLAPEPVIGDAALTEESFPLTHKVMLEPAPIERTNPAAFGTTELPTLLHTNFNIAFDKDFLYKGDNVFGALAGDGGTAGGYFCPVDLGAWGRGIGLQWVQHEEPVLSGGSLPKVESAPIWIKVESIDVLSCVWLGPLLEGKLNTVRGWDVRAGYNFERLSDNAEEVKVEGWVQEMVFGDWFGAFTFGVVDAPSLM